MINHHKIKINYVKIKEHLNKLEQIKDGKIESNLPEYSAKVKIEKKRYKRKLQKLTGILLLFISLTLTYFVGLFTPLIDVPLFTSLGAGLGGLSLVGAIFMISLLDSTLKKGNDGLNILKAEHHQEERAKSDAYYALSRDVKADFENDTLLDSFRDGTISKEGLDRFKKYENIKKYQKEGVASVYDLAAMSGQPIKFIKEEFKFFIEEEWLLNVEVLPGSGIFAIDGEPLYKPSEGDFEANSDQHGKERTAEEIKERLRCRGCGSLYGNKELTVCEYCGLERA